MRHSLSFILFILISVTSNAHSEIIVTNAWARIGANSTAIYFDIQNNKNHDINIIGVSSDKISKSVSIHNSYVDVKGISRTTNINKVLIPQNTKISFKPTGLHLVLHNIPRNIDVGDQFEIKLKFDDGIEKLVKVVVIAKT